MSIRTIIYLGDERLTTPSKPVTTFDTKLQILIDDMFETMYFEDGIGLAAPQIGIDFQLTVIDITKDRSEKWCFINPEIIWHDDSEVWMKEGCLSIPGVYDEVKRAAKIKVKALDRNGKPFEVEADDLFARCIQHECDHLKGKLFIYHLTDMKRQRAIEQYSKIIRQRKKKTTIV